MSDRTWKIAFFCLLALVMAASAALPFLDSLRRRGPTGTRADAVEALRSYGTPEDAIVLFRAEHGEESCEFRPAACLRLPKGDAGYDWKSAQVFAGEEEKMKRCQGAIAFVHAGESARNVAYIYDGIVGLPTDFGTTVTLADYLAAIGEEGGLDSE